MALRRRPLLALLAGLPALALQGPLPGVPCAVDDRDACGEGRFCRTGVGSCAAAVGACAVLPNGCAHDYDPVCGCDNRTYGNECGAHMGAVSVASRGACNDTRAATASDVDALHNPLLGIACSVDDPGVCGEGHFCRKDARSCDAAGACAVLPNECLPVDDPVCGCDNRTYGNECEAHANVVSVARWGACNDTTAATADDAGAGANPDALLGIACAAGDHGVCGEGNFCRTAAWSCSAVGACAVLPNGCNHTDDPVCGCDGGTYGNECEAHAHGVSAARWSSCHGFIVQVASVHQVRECTVPNDCDEGWFCRVESGACDAGGTCALRPVRCRQVWDPVCGCDGKTYNSPCVARLAGISVVGQGGCTRAGSCEVGACDEGSFCLLEEGVCHGARGTCVANYDGSCDDPYDPVCGCDGVTYSNECVAYSKGISVKKAGACHVLGTTCRAPDHDACGEGNFCRTATGSCSAAGICSFLPHDCSALFSPVCGCDGETYGSECEAHAHGVSVASQAACDDALTPWANSLDARDGCAVREDCGEGWFCRTEMGACDGAGTCAAVPVRCRHVLDPVCGCDGKTYNSPCAARLAGVSVARQGGCPTGRCAAGTCDEGSFCLLGEGACSSAQGTCVIIHDGPCDDRYDPVCGCDGVTYSNDCMAQSEGTSLQRAGHCSDPLLGKACAAGDHGVCGARNFCRTPTGSCGAAGTCAFLPKYCDFVFRPVCGCDGATYSNDCEAHAHGVGVASQGACDGTGTAVAEDLDASRGCTVDEDCDKGWFCQTEMGACHAAGTCATIPVLCEDRYNPVDVVCGCDGRMYSNECEARAASTNVVGRGECRDATALDQGDRTPVADSLMEMGLDATDSAKGPYADSLETAKELDPRLVVTANASDSGATEKVQLTETANKSDPASSQPSNKLDWKPTGSTENLDSRSTDKTNKLALDERNSKPTKIRDTLSSAHISPLSPSILCFVMGLAFFTLEVVP